MEAFNRGLVFCFLQGSYDAHALCRALDVSFSDYLNWIHGGDIREEHLNRALELFGADREIYDYLCSPAAVMKRA